MAGISLEKIFYLLTGFMIVTLYFMIIRDFRLPKKEENLEMVLDTVKRKSENIKYILQWTSPNNVPFVYMGKGNSTFVENNCEYKNCFVTSDKELLGDYKKFDVIVFSGPDLVRMNEKKLPQRRSPFQKYAFASIESPDYYPICSNTYDGYFNWTWTFKLDSDSRWGYLIVRDSKGTIIGPNKEMHWLKLEDMDPVPNYLREKLKSKRKLAAWFVSNCVSRSKREKLVSDLNKQLKEKGYEIDIYGQCGPNKCSRDNETVCDEIIERDYYFYLSFENALSEDYVTEKLLRALEFNAVPVVYGAANYSRFMPDGIYLNAREMTIEDLAKKMVDIKNNFDEYVEFFKWKNHYTYHRRNIMPETNDYCGFCAILNNDAKVEQTSVYENFRKWWNRPGMC